MGKARRKAKRPATGPEVWIRPNGGMAGVSKGRTFKGMGRIRTYRSEHHDPDPFGPKDQPSVRVTLKATDGPGFAQPKARTLREGASAQRAPSPAMSPAARWRAFDELSMERWGCGYTACNRAQRRTLRRLIDQANGHPMAKRTIDGATGRPIGK